MEHKYHMHVYIDHKHILQLPVAHIAWNDSTEVGQVWLPETLNVQKSETTFNLFNLQSYLKENKWKKSTFQNWSSKND